MLSFSIILNLNNNDFLSKFSIYTVKLPPFSSYGSYNKNEESRNTDEELYILFILVELLFSFM